MKLFSWICIFSALLLPVMGYKTKSMVLQDQVWDQGQYEKTFINQDANLQLTPEFNKVFSVTDSVIWDVYREGERTWVATGSEGGVYLFEEEQLRTRFHLADKEITSIAKGGEFMYFGSGSEGKVFRIPDSLTTGKEIDTPWVETGEQFIWDLQVYKNSLWLATGGERGKVFRVPLDGTGVPAEEMEPVLIFAEPNALKLSFREEVGTAYLYAAVSTAGKLYRIELADIGKPTGKLQVLFDAGDKDVADFIFVEESVYLITSGTEKIVRSESSHSPQEENAHGGLIDPQGLSGDFQVPSLGEDYENFLVQVDPNREVKFLYRFRKKNPVRLAYRETEGHLYIGVLENAEVYQMTLQEKGLPKSVEIFSRPSATLSDLYLFRDQIYFTLANWGDIYRLENHTANRGEYLTKVFDFKETVYWGQVVVENHNPGTEVQVWSRSGSTQTPKGSEADAEKTNRENLTPVEDWSSWAEVVEGKILSPPARFLQIKLELIGSGGKGFSSHPFESDSPLIKNVKVFYGQKNSPHRITSFKVYKQEFNPMLLGGDQSLPTPGGLFEVYDADHSLNTTYSTEDKNLIPSLNPETSQLPFPKIGKKEYALKWEVENFDQDVLIYTLYYRNYLSSQPERWRPFRDNYLGTMILLDGYKFIDGVYQFKVVAEDRLQNHEEAVYRAEAVTVQQVFDNQPPIIEDLRWQGDTLFFKVRDALSPIASVKYTIDRQTVSLLSPRDGIYDEGEEEFQFPMEGVSEMTLIVKDGADNILYHDVVKTP